MQTWFAWSVHFSKWDLRNHLVTETYKKILLVTIILNVLLIFFFETVLIYVCILGRQAVALKVNPGSWGTDSAV